MTTPSSSTPPTRGGQKGSYRDNPVDAIAAALLLQGWLDENAALLEH